MLLQKLSCVRTAITEVPSRIEDYLNANVSEDVLVQFSDKRVLSNNSSQIFSVCIEPSS